MSEEQREMQGEEEEEEDEEVVTEGGGGEAKEGPPQMSTQEIERQEEAKLKAKYPSAVRPMGGHSAFLQKRLAKGQKYFDSGDYQMAKQKVPPAMARLPPVLSQSTGDAIPTPESVPMRKTSIIQQSKLAHSNLT